MPNVASIFSVEKITLMCPVVTYVLLGLYAAFRRPTNLAQWEKTRALLTLVSFVANVLLI